MDEKTETRDALAKSVLFGSLSQEAIEAIAEITQTLKIPQDTILGKMGDPSRGCCIIVSGRVEVSRPGRKGLEYKLGQLGPGQSFGELNLLSNEPISVLVKTVEETHLIIIPRDHFEAIIKNYPEVTAAIGKRFSFWLQRAGSIIEEQSKLQFESHHLRWIDFIPIIILSFLFGLAFNASNPKGIPFFQKSFSNAIVPFINPSEVYEKYQQGELLIVDAQPSIFYVPEHIKNALNLPLSTFDFMYDLRLGKTDKSQEIIVYGRTISQHYDEKLAEKLVVRGFRKVKILKGGLFAWKEKKYPVEP
jgi:rhodanese-related sulfurtransferase